MQLDPAALHAEAAAAMLTQETFSEEAAALDGYGDDEGEGLAHGRG